MIRDKRFNFPRIDKTAFSVASLFDESDEKAYWLAQSYQQRLKHMEYLRRINYGYHVTPRLQRFFEVAKRQKS